MADLVKVLDVKANIGDAEQKLGKLQNKVRLLNEEKKRLNKAVKNGKISQDQYGKAIARNTIETKKAQMGVRQYSKSILAANGHMKKTSGFVMGIRKAMTGMAAQFIGVMGAFMLVKNVIGVFKDFEQANADLAAVLGVNREEMSELTEDAKRLGSVTAFTATEVSQLQKEFAKLGFSTEEILNATEATLNLAAATNTDLARAAEVAGSTVRAFGLDAKDTQRVTDVMAKSFSSSALDMEKFATAMRSVAPVAKNAGLNIEQTTSMLGVLVDRGVDASTAGTALRNVFLELSKQGITFEEAMKQINTSTDKNATALELFGKRGAVVGTILSETADDAARLEEKLNDAGGAAAAMAETQLNTLSGKTTLLKSAWEGLILSFEDGDGVLSRTLKGAVDGMTKFLGLVQNINKSTEEIISTEAIKASKDWLSFLDEKESLQAKAAVATIELKRANEDLIANEKVLLEIQNEIAETSATRRAHKAKELQNNINESKILIQRDKERIRVLTEVIAERKKETDLNAMQQKSIKDLTFLAGQGIELAKTALGEKIRLAEEAAEKEAESNLTLKERIALITQLQIDQASLFQEHIKGAEEIAEAEKNLRAFQEEGYNIFAGENDEDIVEDSDFLVEQFRLTHAGKQQALEMAFEQEEISQEEFNAKMKALDDKLKDEKIANEEEIRQKKIKSAEGYFNVASSLTNTLSDIFTASKNKELSAAGDNAKKREEIERKYAQKEKAIAISQAIIRGALAVMRIASDVPKADYGVATAILIAVQAAATIGQVALIASQKMAKGGVLKGKSHARGGIPTMDGQYEFEGGEAVINKRSTAKYGALLSQINQAGGGIPFARGGVTKFQDGGINAPISFPDSETDLISTSEQLTAQMGAIKVVNLVSETTEQQTNILNVTSEAEMG